jgi:hypothetical protein
MPHSLLSHGECRSGLAVNEAGSPAQSGSRSPGELLNDVRNALDNVFPVVIAPSFSNVATNPNALTLASPWSSALATLALTANGYQARPGNPYLQSYNFTGGAGSRTRRGF